MKTKLIFATLLLAITPLYASLSRDDRAAWEGAIIGYKANGTSPDEKAKISLIQRMLDATDVQATGKTLLAEVEASSITARNKAIRRNIVNTMLSQDSTTPELPPVVVTAPNGSPVSKAAGPRMLLPASQLRPDAAEFGPISTNPDYRNGYVLAPALLAGVSEQEADALFDRNFGATDWFDEPGVGVVWGSQSSGRPDGTDVGQLFFRFYVSNYEDTGDTLAIVEGDFRAPMKIATEGKDYEKFGEVSWAEWGTNRRVHFSWYQSRSRFTTAAGSDALIRPVLIPSVK